MKSEDNKRIYYGAIIVWLSVAALYSPVATFDFLNFDDNAYITDNPHVASGLSWENIRWAFSSAHAGHWHPLAWISHMLDCQLFGLAPGPHHLVNLALHATNTVLVFLLLVFCTNAFGASLFAALVFGIHPMRLESVVWVTERKDVLSVFFLLLSLIAYQAYTKKSDYFKYALSLVCFLLSLLSKPTAVVLPLLLLLLDYWPLKRVSVKSNKTFSMRVWIEKIPFVLGALACSVATILAQSSGGGLKSLSDYPLSDRTASVLVGYLSYLGKFFFPSGFGIFYPFTQYQPGVAAGALVAIISIFAWCVKYRNSHPYIIVGWLWFIISLLPVIGIVQIGGQAFADRWSYLSHLGLLFGVIWAWRSTLGSRFGNFLNTSIAALVLLLLGGATFFQLPNWRNSESIFRHTLQVSPDNFMAHMNLGVALDHAGKFDEALTHYERSVQLRPFYPDALSNLGGARARLGDYVSAQGLLERSISANPNLVPSRHNLGLIYARDGRLLEALVQWLYIIHLDRAYSPARENIEGLLKRFWVEGCSLFPYSESTKRGFAEIGNILGAWPSPRDEVLRGALVKVLACQPKS